MKNDNLVYVKFDYDEGVQSKKIILSSEMNMIRILKIIKNYHSFRTEELKLKLKLYKKIKEINAKIKKIQDNLPEVETSKKLKKGVEKIEIKKSKEKKYDLDLEKQLMEIRGKLKELEG